MHLSWTLPPSFRPDDNPRQGESEKFPVAPGRSGDAFFDDARILERMDGQLHALLPDRRERKQSSSSRMLRTKALKNSRHVLSFRRRRTKKPKDDANLPAKVRDVKAKMEDVVSKDYPNYVVGASVRSRWSFLQAASAAGGSTSAAPAAASGTAALEPTAPPNGSRRKAGTNTAAKFSPSKRRSPAGRRTRSTTRSGCAPGLRGKPPKPFGHHRHFQIH